MRYCRGYYHSTIVGRGSRRRAIVPLAGAVAPTDDPPHTDGRMIAIAMGWNLSATYSEVMPDEVVA